MSTYSFHGNEKLKYGGANSSMVSPIFFFSQVPVFNVPYTPSYTLPIQFANQLYLITKEAPVRLCLCTPIHLKFSKNSSHPIALKKKPSRLLSFHESLYPIVINLIN